LRAPAQPAPPDKYVCVDSVTGLVSDSNEFMETLNDVDGDEVFNATRSRSSSPTPHFEQLILMAWTRVLFFGGGNSPASGACPSSEPSRLWRCPGPRLDLVGTRLDVRKWIIEAAVA